MPKNLHGVDRIQYKQSVILVGANGCGKTRLGVWIEQKYGKMSHRICAGRCVSLPQFVGANSTNVFVDSIFFDGIDADAPLIDVGLSNGEDVVKKRERMRWRSDPAISVPDKEFSKLLDFALHVSWGEADIGTDVKGRALQNEIIDSACKIWERTLHGRSIRFELAQNVKCSASEDSHCGFLVKICNLDASAHERDGQNMSDGERAAFFLICQVLCAPRNAVLIVDEPEIHLHPALRDALWNDLQTAREDLTFIFITHDLDFAGSRPNGRIVWVKNFVFPSSWDWDDVSDESDEAELPSQLLLNLLGVQNDILFVEGSRKNCKGKQTDADLYEALYPGVKVVPVHSSEEVQRSVVALKKLDQLFPSRIRKVAGIVDRDRKSDGEIRTLSKKGVFVLQVAEFENLFLLEEVLVKLNPARAKAAIEKIFSIFEKDIQKQIMDFLRDDVNWKLGHFAVDTEKSVGEIQRDLQEHVSKIRIDELSTQRRESFERILRQKDYCELLKVFNNKGILNQILTLMEIPKYRTFQLKCIECIAEDDDLRNLIIRKYIELDTSGRYQPCDEDSPGSERLHTRQVDVTL